MLNYGHREGEIVYSQFKDLVPRNVEYKDEDLAGPDAETEAEIAARTRAALSEILDSMLLIFVFLVLLTVSEFSQVGAIYERCWREARMTRPT